MYREHLRRVLGHFKRALRKDQRLTAEEFNQRLQLSEAIIDYGRMIQVYYGYSVPDVILEITASANRFRVSERRRRPLKTRSGCCGTSSCCASRFGWMLEVATGRYCSQRSRGFSPGDAPLPYVGRKTNEIHFGQKAPQPH
jgi:hypothetical protein